MTRRKLLSLVGGALLLSACSGEQGELQAWMDQVRRDTRPISDVIPEPKQYEPFRYDNVGQIEPFSSSKLQAAFDRMVQRSAGGLKPDLNRRREPLEAFPLESIRMVGHLSNGKQNFALLQVESLVYQARVGTYAGQNFGTITKISENEVKLKELVQDAAGDWVERVTELRLQEGGRK